MQFLVLIFISASLVFTSTFNIYGQQIKPFLFMFLYICLQFCIFVILFTWNEILASILERLQSPAFKMKYISVTSN